jgi:putative MATE family efflux protein
MAGHEERNDHILKKGVGFMKQENDMGRDSIPGLVIRIAIPSMLAQFVSVLYSIVDRMFVGNIPDHGDLALAGIGICGPVVTMVGAFAFLVGIGGAPLMGISLGEGRKERASHILSNCFSLLCAIALAATALALVLKEPMLRLFGASDVTYPYADRYFTVYICGTVFALLSTGMNQFIISQGYAKVGMFSVILGAVLNIVLDPLFIFALHMGVTGAALATVISQAASAVFVLHFLRKKSAVPLVLSRPNLPIMARVLKLGFAPFVIIAVDSVMIIAMNALLQRHGGAEGDALITCNTIVQSFMLVMTMPLGGISGGTQGILSYNYGAGNSDRVRQAQKYIIGLCVAYTALLFVLARVAGATFVGLFTTDAVLNIKACRAIRICTLAAIPLGIQYAVVDGFTGMGQVQVSLPLSVWRKTVYFVAVFLLPVFLGADMIFYAEPIADILGPMVAVPVQLVMGRRVLRQREAELRRI